MKQILQLVLITIGLVGMESAVLGDIVAVPPEIRQDLTPYNFQSFRGVPIDPRLPGADHRLSFTNESFQSVNQPTNFHLFQGFVSFGGLARATNWQSLTNHADLYAGTNPFSATVAMEMGLPVGQMPASSTVVAILRRAQVGAPFINRQISFLFGSEIPSPNTDERGILLTNGVFNTNYWLAQPFFTTNQPDVGQGYYWSPNAQRAFAIQSGPITVTWRKANPYNNTTITNVANYQDASGSITNTNGVVFNFQTNGGSIFLLYTARYLVSSSPVKTPQKIYWTEAPFDQNGHLVNVPVGSVSAFHIAFNSHFPQFVNTPYLDPNDTSPHPPAQTQQLTNTLWYAPLNQAGALHAYNIEGRVFVELLGEALPDNTRRSLGFEIVDVFKEPLPTDVTVNLGDRVPAYQDGRDDSELTPDPTLATPQKFYYRQSRASGEQVTLYATFATGNLNDFQVHWLKPSLAGLKWPFLFNRYHEVWPDDPTNYVHYLRPLVGSEVEAKSTAVALPGSQAPQIPYQDPFPSPFGAKLENGRFYTFLSRSYPAHRTLLQYTLGDQVAFERVFSWLDVSIQDNAIALYSGATNLNSILAGSVATSLSRWNSTNLTLNFPVSQVTPYYISNVVRVGDRILAPVNESGSAGDYLAGYILRTNGNAFAGNAFHPGAYLDPFAFGFEQANQGAIIPVNAIPGNDQLEVWWFRPDHPDIGHGFKPSYWPAVVAHYKIEWPPTDSNEIILASNDGSGPLDSLQARGTIYRQNDRSLPGFNPNEEHALMLGGQAYALRDDLNVTNNSNGEYTSAPYVLLTYTGSDNRPAMRVFPVRREKPEAGIVFDYTIEAGKVLQAPMPLPLLPPPLSGAGASATNYNYTPQNTSGDLPTGWSSDSANGPFGHYAQFTFEDRKHNLWVYRGLHAGPPRLEAGHYDASQDAFLALPDATAVSGQPFAYFLHTSRNPEGLSIIARDLPGWASVQTTNGLAIVGTPLGPSAPSNFVTLIISDPSDNSVISNTFALLVTNNPAMLAEQGPLVLASTNPYTHTVLNFTNRVPQVAQSPAPSNSFTMRFYYPTDPTFDWPGMVNPPAAGSVVPYLLPRDSQGNNLGDPTSPGTPSQDIVYRPVWPSIINGQPVPFLFSGETLTTPKRGMAAVRGQSSGQVLYQQSIAQDLPDAPASVVLYDPTVQKTAILTNATLKGLPPSVVAQPYLGKMYFPNLPPNLKERFFFDPNTSSLVLQGKFVDDPVGEKYVLLNVLRGADLAAVLALCPTNDTQNKPIWDNAVTNLAASVLTFQYKDGQYVANPDLTVTRSGGEVVEVTQSDTQVDSYALGATGPGVGYVSYIVGNGRHPAHASEPVSLYILRVVPELYRGELKVISDSNPLSEQISFQHTADLAGHSTDYEYDWRIQPPSDGQVPANIPTNDWTALVSGSDLSHYTLTGSAGIQSLSDNYLTLRYRSVDPLASPASTNWSEWTPAVLAEGWIKRVLAGINPFNQRTTDLFNNPVNTNASIISQAGHRYEGDVALNQDTLNNFGLIEIYETVLNRGKNLSIDAGGGGINYGPANDALLLAAGYLNDLYMMLGNEAWSDAANPTIGIGTADKTYGNIATALFSFKGQVPSLLEEELALLRGRDDFIAPGVQTQPVYNRLFWNYTRGIDAGEVIYSLNYNILDQDHDGVINAKDAAVLYPQGHGDAYGHYLTALTHYYSLLLNPQFDWVPRAEAVTVLGATVAVDYQDERKFAAASAALARTGRQVFDLAWRQSYQPGTGGGWGNFDNTRTNFQRTYVATSVGGTNRVTRFWGLDHWGSRVGQGAFLHWLVGNAILPPVDPDPTHEGIQKVDRTTVPELAELPATASQIQTDMDNAEAGFTPLSLSQNSIPFDINPLQVTGANPQTHFEQIYQRAVGTLNNATVAFDDAQNVGQLMRSEEDSLANYQAAYDSQEVAYNNQLIELYGSPYPDDVGPGKTYQQGYSGADLIHYTYVENPDTNFPTVIPDVTANQTFYVDIQNLSTNWSQQMISDLSGLGINLSTSPGWTNDPTLGTNNPAQNIAFNIGPNGFFDKPPGWIHQREAPGRIQQAISDLIAAQNRLRKAVVFETYDKQALDKAMMAFTNQIAFELSNTQLQNDNSDLQKQINTTQETFAIADKWLTLAATAIGDVVTALPLEVPDEVIIGTSVGGNQLRLSYLGLYVALEIAKGALLTSDAALFTASMVEATGKQNEILDNLKNIANAQVSQDTKNGILALGNQELNIQGDLFTINEALRTLEDKQRAYKALVAEGNRLQQERLTFRQHAAAVIQGYRTRDAAFRLFKNEKLERYKTLFDLAAKYAFLAAQAYDYETGLLNTDQGRAFLNRIISSRALGVVNNGQPQFAGSDTGDPGLSSALAEMKADWDVLKSRLGFNNPDGYGTVASLRTENYRVLPGNDGRSNWKDVLQRGRMANLLDDPDVRRYCMQIDDGSGQPVPGIILTFSTIIAPGLNLFGQPLAPGDHNYNSSSFATKIFALGVDFEGYIGMDNPNANVGSGGTSPTDPTLNPLALAATPYIYLIPVGVDAMRSPPLGDASTIRNWNVDDLTIPLPFNIGASGFSTDPIYNSASSLSEPLFSVRKHQAFRPVSTADAFSPNIYSSSGGLQPSQFTNKRLVGRSVWNSKWKLVIPGVNLLSEPNQGLSRFIESVTDVKLNFITYSYAGN